MTGPDLSKKPTINHLARIAVEFSYNLRASCRREDFLRDDPPSRVYWTVTLGRLALCRDGSWAYAGDGRYCRTKNDFEALRAQRFVRFEEAVRVATTAFGVEPEHATYMRRYVAEIEKTPTED